jgi:hypothetical protein
MGARRGAAHRRLAPGAARRHTARPPARSARLRRHGWPPAREPGDRAHQSRATGGARRGRTPGDSGQGARGPEARRGAWPRRRRPWRPAAAGIGGRGSRPCALRGSRRRERRRSTERWRRLLGLAESSTGARRPLSSLAAAPVGDGGWGRLGFETLAAPI